MANSYNVENLIETLNALKQDKILRERRYYETKQKRRRAVAEAEQAEMVLRQRKDRHAKSTHLLKVAQYKVMKMQERVKQVNDLNAQKRKGLQQLQAQKARINEKHSHVRTKFQKDMHHIATNLRQARKYFNPENVQVELEKQQTLPARYDAEIEQVKKDKDQIVEQMRELKLKREAGKPDIPVEEQRAKFGALLSERRALEQERSGNQARLALLRTRAAELRDQVQKAKAALK